MFHKGKHDREKQLRFSIRKVSFGAASVAVAALFMFLGNGAVSAAEQSVPSTNGETQAPQPKDQNVQNGTYEGNTVATSPAATVETNTQPSTVENSPSPESAPQKVETLDKKELTDLIKEIDGKFAKGTYATKTEESVNNLRAVLEEARTDLSTATTQTELTAAYRKLITATSKLQTKPEEKKEVPAVDTTNGKSTVGVKATNTEKAADTNSIANSGSRDERNGKELNNNNPLRTDGSTTDTDPTANQTYTAPAENADLATLADKLKNLPNVIENNKKVQDMDTLGNALNVEKGSVKEINEFGGWKAVGDTGKFAIARKTEAGVFPAYTVNINRTNRVWVREQSFDRSSEYILLLAKLVTKQNRDEPIYDNKPYLENNEPGAQTARAAKWFDGIEKTFKAYATNEGTKVTVSFKTGYTGDNNGSKAKYKVEVFSIENDTEKSIYTAVVSPETAVNNSEMKVVAAKDGNARNETINASGFTKEKIEEKLALPENRPNATGGTFTSREIDLPKGVTSYKVRISLENKHQAGMSYNSTYLQYSLPITGSDFNVNQDTSVIAKNLLSRIYDKLKATETEDTDGKTNDTKAAYLAELENTKTLITSTDVKKTAEYKQALESILSKHLALEVDKTGLKNAKEALNILATEADPTTGKTADSAKTYTDAKTAAQQAIQVAQTVIDNTDATVAQVK
ncbi:YSIRK-type signal peptide-containing protein, partial [Streptococcus pseudopneumoniae]|uniref:YSIRK-type signal peptide-containing protein n=1 Tax=Streptococcus pseudopneumoniae TaxID=257758 RepID=UPI0003D32811